MDLGSLKQTVRKYYKESYTERYLTTTPQFGSEANAINGLLGCRITTVPGAWTITGPSTVTIGRGNLITFDCGEDCQEIYQVGFVGVVSGGNWPSMTMTSIQCSVDGQYWDEFGDFGGRGDYYSNPSSRKTFTAGNNYRYLRFTNWVDDGRYGQGGVYNFTIWYYKRDKIVEESTRSNYDYYIDYELPKASYINDTTETHYYKKAEINNIWINGSPTINGHIVNTTSGNYPIIPTIFDINQDWEIVLKINRPSSSNFWEVLGVRSNSYYGVNVYLHDTVVRLAYNHQPNVTWTYTDQSVSTPSNTWFYFKYKKVGTTFTVYYSTDGETYEQKCTYTFGTSLYGVTGTEIMVDFSSSIIDLKDSYIKVNDEYVWRGTSEYITETTSDDPDIYETKTITKTNVKHIDRSY